MDLTNATIRFHQFETDLIEGSSGHPCIHLLGQMQDEESQARTYVVDEDADQSDDDENEEAISDYEEYALHEARKKDWWHDEEDDGESDHGRDGEEQDDLTTSDDSTSSEEEPAMETDDKGSYMTQGGRRQIRASLR